MDEKTKPCPFCKEQIKDEAIKCRYCQSSLLKANGASSTEKIADLVVKAVGIVPIIMTLLLGLAAIYGIKTVSDVQSFAKRAESSSQAIEGQRELISKLVISEIERNVDVLLNDLSIDSVAPRAISIRQGLKDLLHELDKQEASGARKSRKGFLLRALFAYYDKKYDDGLDLLKQAGDEDLNKFRLMGGILIRKGEEAEQAGKAQEAKKLQEQGSKAFATADKMGQEENRTLWRNRGNLAASYVKVGRYDDAEKILIELIEKDPDNQFHYYNLAALYSRWGKFENALEYLERGTSRKIGVLTRKNLSEDVDFNNLRTSTNPEVQRRYSELLTKIPQK